MKISVNLILEIQLPNKDEEKLFLDDLRADMEDMLLKDYNMELSGVSGGITVIE